MVNKDKNQSQDLTFDTKKKAKDFINCLSCFRSALTDIALSLDQVFVQLNTNSKRLEKLLLNPENEKLLWSIEDAEKHLQMIIFLAGVGKPQLLQYEDFLVQVTSAKG